MLQVQEVAQRESLAIHRAEWNALVDRSTTGEFFHTYEWLTTWLETFWKDRPIAFLFVREGQTLVGLAPLLQDAGGELGCPQSLISPINDHAARSDVIHLDERQQDVLDALLSHIRETRGRVRLTFKTVDQTSPVLAALPTTATRHRLVAARSDLGGSPIVRLAGNWEEYLKSRARHVRSELKRKAGKVEKAGAVEWVTVTTVEQCESAFKDVFEIERHSWKEHAGTSFTAEAGLDKFYKGLALRCAGAGWLRMHLLYLDAKPVAHLYGMVFKNEYYALKTSYHEAFRHISPGAVLLAHALRDACELGLATFDLLGDESRWKNEMATEIRSYAKVCLFSRSQLRCQWCEAYEHGVKPFIKSKAPALVTLKRKLTGVGAPAVSEPASSSD